MTLLIMEWLDDDKMTKRFIQGDRKKSIEKAHLENENKRLTICISLHKKDNTMPNENLKSRKSKNYLQKYDSGH